MIDWVLKINYLSSSSSFTSSNQLFSICSMSASCYVSISHHLQRPSHFVCCSTTVSLCVLLNDRLTLCVAQRPSHFVCCSTTISLCMSLNDHLTLCVAQRPSHFVCRSTTISLCVSLNDHLTLCVAQRPSHFVCCRFIAHQCKCQCLRFDRCSNDQVWDDETCSCRCQDEAPCCEEGEEEERTCNMYYDHDWCE